MNDDDTRVRLLYVCVGNVCRSAFAERLSRYELGLRLGAAADAFAVSSAGTAGRDGAPMHPFTATLLPAFGADPHDFAARRLTPVLLREADLVLTATGRERDEAVSMLPAALRRTFTLNEFARLAAHVPTAAAPESPAARLQRVVGGALALRGRIPLTGPAGDDIPDPARTLPAFHTCFQQIAHAVRSTVTALCAGAETAGAIIARQG